MSNEMDREHLVQIKKFDRFNNNILDEIFLLQRAGGRGLGCFRFDLQHYQEPYVSQKHQLRLNREGRRRQRGESLHFIGPIKTEQHNKGNMQRFINLFHKRINNTNPDVVGYKLRL